ncbi:MAG: hypothetical protein ACK4UJ_03480 [Leptonema sp. (in: bacteria)]
MKAKKFLIFVTLQLLGFFSLNAQQITEKIEKIELFGIEIGGVMEGSTVIKTTKTDKGDVVYLLEPKENKYFDFFYASVEPNTNKIYKIFGRTVYDSKHDCLTNLGNLITILKEKYQEKLVGTSYGFNEKLITYPIFFLIEEDSLVQRSFYMVSTYEAFVKKSNVDIKISCGKLNLFDSSYIMYFSTNKRQEIF